MLELYHSVNSVCAQKVRVALEEKQLTYVDYTMTLRGDQFELSYLKLNPNGVVPTLVHDGHREHRTDVDLAKYVGVVAVALGLSGFLCEAVVRHARTKRSLNMTANCVFASAHSRGGRFHSAAA